MNAMTTMLIRVVIPYYAAVLSPTHCLRGWTQTGKKLTSLCEIFFPPYEASFQLNSASYAGFECSEACVRDSDIRPCSIPQTILGLCYSTY